MKVQIGNRKVGLACIFKIRRLVGIAGNIVRKITGLVSVQTGFKISLPPCLMVFTNRRLTAIWEKHREEIFKLRECKIQENCSL